MSANELPLIRTLLLGAEESRYGAYRLVADDPDRVACALSVGRDPRTPAMAAKGDPSVPNEDALFVLDQGDAALLAVADAHFGAQASHGVLRGLADELKQVPASPAELERALRDVVEQSAEPGEPSETTLLAVVLRRDLRAGFGFSIGDSTCALVGGGASGRPLNRRNAHFVRRGQAWARPPGGAGFFEYETAPEALLVLFTDGIDGCHYGHPLTSLGPSQLVELFARLGARPASYAAGLTEWALAGREGAPGGQDNIALAVAAT